MALISLHMTNNTLPVLSIVMPCFNHSELISEMIDSIIANDYNDWELLAIDDGSETNHLAVLNNYEARDARIHVIKRDRLPKGAPTCRNIGLYHFLRLRRLYHTHMPQYKGQGNSTTS